ncbi:cytochrome P450 family protein [Yinghuangia sp. YIM S10712]|uniref:cytochrome P450 family protein n=1 Tax=Yinghuangia sp. YIM S10712 TaxID=3436930 RepID=UPI003F529D33
MSQDLITLDTTGRDLYAEADRLRAAGPAVRVRLPGDLVAWSVTRGDVVRRLLVHPAISKDARRSWPAHKPGDHPWLTVWTDIQSMFTSDGDDHRRLRNLIAPAFLPRRIDAMRPLLDRIVGELLDEIAAVPPGTEIDLRAAYSYPIPTRVICGLFGVPDDQGPEIMRIIDGVLDTTATPEQAARTGADLYAAMHTLVATKRRHPGDDMTSMLIAARDGHDRLNDAELVSTLILMIGAGSESTVSLLDHAAHQLLTQPEDLARAQSEPGMWDQLIEETLRLHPPIMHLPLRYVTDRIDLGDGVVLEPEDLVLIGFGAHGRDPGRHTEADRFDLDRADKEHLAFGHGVHYCLGAPLARHEAAVALPALFGRFPKLRLAHPDRTPAPQPSFITNNFARLPVLV